MMWSHIKVEVVDNKFSLALASFVIGSLLTIHATWGDGFDGDQLRTVMFLMCVTAALLTLHLNRVFVSASVHGSPQSALARLGVIALFWVGALGALSLTSRTAGVMSADLLWGSLSASGLLAGLNAIFALGNGAACNEHPTPQLDRMVGVLLETLLVGAALFWAGLISGYFDSAAPLRGFLLYVFFTPVGAFAHLLLGALLWAVSFIVFSLRRAAGRAG